MSKTTEELIKIADEIYKKVKSIVKEDNGFLKLKDQDKMTYFRDKLQYADFLNEFPITARYMICMGQFSKKAFRRFLDKVRMNQKNLMGPREKGYVEDQWIRRQADYVRYLWESYQKSHYNNAEAQFVWEDTYNKLKGEFSDFRDKYKEIETNTKKQKEELNAENAKELLLRLKSKEQTIDEDDAKQLLFQLKSRLFKRRFSNSLVELLSKVKYIEHSSEGIGHGSETPDNKPTIKMIETVADERIHEIPNQLLLDEKMAQTLPGFN